MFIHVNTSTLSIEITNLQEEDIILIFFHCGIVYLKINTFTWNNSLFNKYLQTNF